MVLELITDDYFSYFRTQLFLNWEIFQLFYTRLFFIGFTVLCFYSNRMNYKKTFQWKVESDEWSEFQLCFIPYYKLFFIDLQMKWEKYKKKIQDE